VARLAARPVPEPHCIEVTSRLLARWPLPRPEDGADKEDRGRVLVVAGATELIGAAVLAGTAALRAGAGKLQYATCASIMTTLAAAVPEARVFGCPETERGGIHPDAADLILDRARHANALLLGPGLVDADAVSELAERLLAGLERTPLVLDAEALMCVEGSGTALRQLRVPAILTPHAGEMARMLGMPREDVERQPAEVACRAAGGLQAVVVLKGAVTHIASPDGRLYGNRRGNVGLATSGSGDTLAGVIAGLTARGAEPVQAAVWGVFLHALAGERLAETVGPLGFLAREIPDQIPGLMAQIERSSAVPRARGGRDSTRRPR
jgi:hydroxyethylthiazole kinase-like uncharacterized protein yjeF